MEEFLKILKKHWLKNDIPNVSIENALFLREIIKRKKVANLLEIGTANWFSSINFAFEMKEIWGKITTIDFSKKSYDEANENFKQAWVSDMITSLFGNALDILPTLKWPYDFIFIDGMKRRTVDFLQLTYDKLSPGWTIVIDDVIKFKPKMVGLYEYLKKNNIEHEILQIDSDDGILIIEKN